MTGYGKIQPYYSPIKSFEEFTNLHVEMTVEQCTFLCGLIKEFRPRKILEVGVAEGGGTSLLLKTFELLGIQAEIYSVDLSEKLYYDCCLETGYIARQYLAGNQGAESLFHRFFLGHYLPEVLNEIGDGIDFVFLDTVHHMPGEIFDFIAVLPYLRNGAVIAMHDIALSQDNTSGNRLCYSNQILFSVASGEKYLNNETEYPNIAAIKIDNSSSENIKDLFSVLCMPWNYLPTQNELEIYRNWYIKFYDAELLKLFDQAVELNTRSLHQLNDVAKQYVQTLGDSILGSYSRIIFYGKGKRGKALYEALDEVGGEALGQKIVFAVSSKEAAEKNNCFTYADMLIDDTDDVVVLTANAPELRDVLIKDKRHWVEVPETIWSILERVYSR